jgi:hypothetical protein
MQLDALTDLGDALGFGSTQQVRIDGEDPLLATRFRVGEAAATALAAVGVAANDLWELRTGRRQSIEVDVRAAATSLLSFLLCRVTDRDGPGFGDRAVITDFFPARDGRWFFLHGSFPHNQEAALRLLDCPPEKERVGQAIARWDAQELEDALSERGLCGARVRNGQEWREHPQGIALAEHPVVEVLRIGDSDPQPLLGANGPPLEGVRVLDLTRVLAGPTCGRTLAQHGADVLRIASPNLPSIPQFVMDTSFGKRSAHLDLKDAADHARLLALIGDADVFAQGYRSGALDRLGFDPHELAALRPGIVYTSINCYGHVGPWSQRPGWEQLAQTVTGIAAEQGGATPALIPAAPTDYTTGYLAALGTLVALKRRATEGGSYWVRASLSRTGMWIQDLGRAQGIGAGPDVAKSADLFEETDTPFGRVRHLRPALRMSETPPQWSKPSVPLGSHAPVWEPRTQ